MPSDSGSNYSVLANNKYEGRQSTNDSRSNLSVNTYEKCQRTAPKAIFVKPSDEKAIRNVILKILEFDDVKNSFYLTQDMIASLHAIGNNQLCALLYYILTNFLHLIEVTPFQRHFLGNAVVYLIEENYISSEHVKLAYANAKQSFVDLITDVPKLSKYIMEFFGNYLYKINHICFQSIIILYYYY